MNVGHTEKKIPAPSKQVPETSSTSSIGITKILEVMNHPFPFAMVSPLGSDLTSLLQTKDKDANKDAKKVTGGDPSGVVMEETVIASDD